MADGHKFKVGDVVEFVSDKYPTWIGVTGRVSGYSEGGLVIATLINTNGIGYPVGYKAHLTESSLRLFGENAASEPKAGAPQPRCPRCNLDWVTAAPEHVQHVGFVERTVYPPGPGYNPPTIYNYAQWNAFCWRCEHRWVHEVET